MLTSVMLVLTLLRPCPFCDAPSVQFLGKERVKIVCVRCGS